MDLENLTDVQLRQKLLEHGFPLMPITANTRKIMIKKLKLIQNSTKKENVSSNRSLGKYSSDDDSDFDIKPTYKKAVQQSAAQVPSLNTRSSIRHQSTLRSKTQNGNIHNSVQRNSFKKKDLSSDSEPELIALKDTDDEEELQSYHDTNSLDISLNDSFGNKISDTSTSFNSPPKRFTSSPRNSMSITRPEPHVSAFKSASQQNQRLTSPPASSYATNKQFPLTGSVHGYLASDCSSNDSFSNEELQTTTPYLRNFTKRLSQLTANHKKPENRTNKLTRNDNGKAENFFIRYKQKLVKCFSTQINITHPKSAHASENRGNLISVALVGAVGVFFVGLLALYYGMHRGSNTNEIAGLSIPYCTAVSGKDCLTEEEAQSGIDLYKIIKPKLIDLSINHQCSGAINLHSKFYMTDEDITSFVMANYIVEDAQEIARDIGSFVLIAQHNPFLGVNILKLDKYNNIVQSDGAISDKLTNRELGFSGLDDIRAFAVLSPTLPWRCSVWMTFLTFFKYIIGALLIGVILLLGRTAYRSYVHQQRVHAQEVVSLVEKIIEILQAQSEEDQFQVINHVRDMIIPVNSRTKMEKSWKKAVTFINENESRIRTEVQTVKGESYEVWRWIGRTNLNVSSNKSWQGQAFDVHPGSVNTPPCSPTPCLKIRGMIDDTDEQGHKVAVKDALLAKCGPQCRVLHISVDMSSKCVYMKCADTIDAAVAFRNLHGQWFAGHLVTVKYLRLERYMQRFPDSPQQGPPFLKVLS